MNVGFLSTIVYEKKEYWFEHLHEFTEKWLHLWGKKVCILSGSTKDKDLKRVEIKIIEDAYIQRIVICALKIFSYLTVVIPLFMLASKLIFRLNLGKITVEEMPVASPIQQKNCLPPSTISPPRAGKIAEKIEQTQQTQTAALIAHQKRAPLESINPAFPKHSITSNHVAQLVTTYLEAWDPEKKCFQFKNNFNVDIFIEQLSRHVEIFRKNINKKIDFGYINKVDLNPKDNPKIYVRADLHGDLKSLIENLKMLKEQKLLDSNYRCNPGVHLIFLGDYCDRGAYGVHILEILARLREENRDQVHLIRGNHEYVQTNLNYGKNDHLLVKILCNKKQKQILEEFYETMSLSTYFSLKDSSDEREYVQFLHGLPEPTVDPSSLLDSDEGLKNYHCIPKTRHFSERIQNIDPKSPRYADAQRMKNIFNTYIKNFALQNNHTIYNWGDVITQKKKQTSYGCIGKRNFRLSAEDIAACLSIASDKHPVKMLFRGHQHLLQHLHFNGKIIVTTLPIGVETKAFYPKDRDLLMDISYILIPNAKVAQWKKRTLSRKIGESSSTLGALYRVTLNEI